MKIGFVSLGCPKNLVDSEIMLGLVREAGHEVVSDADAADVLVVNTCAFIDAAKQESVDTILEMAERRRTGSCRRLVIAGCLAERYRDNLRKEIPEIDAVLGTGEVPEILRAIYPRDRTGVSTGTAPVTLYRDRPTPAPPTPGYIYDAETPRYRTTPRHFAYVKVAEGCDYACAFCIIPTLRGHYRSRPADSIVREARRLTAEGVREIILISQDTTFYGIDRQERGALARLLHELNAIEDLAWIRLLYLYPTTITDEIVDAIAECEKVCRYIDLPLQHAAAPVLARMRRPGSRQTYERLLRRLRDRVPGITLRTTFIVGFPGETEADFRELCAFVREIEFEHVGVFTYSHEEGTRAHAFPDDVPAGEKRRRQRELMALQRSIVRQVQRSRVGHVLPVLVDGPSPDAPLLWQGRLEGQAPDIDSVVYFTEFEPSSLAPGQIVAAEVLQARDYDLVVRPLPEPQSLRSVV